MRLDFPYLTEDRDRHGNVRLYVRRYDRKVRRHAPDGTLGWLAASYFASQRFQRLDRVTQARRRLLIEECLREPPKPGSKSTMAICPIAKVTAAAVIMLMERKAGSPGAANNRKKYLSAMFGWAVNKGLMKANPARDAERVRYASEGWHTWSEAEVHQFEDKHPIGTKARLALVLLLFTGARRGDVVTLGRQHVREGVLRYVPRKTRYKRLRASEKPWLPELAQVVAASPTGDLTFLVTEHGKPFSDAGFGNWFRKRCDEAGLPHCTAHGLKKAGATICAENGATVHQLMALFDWSTPAQAKVYTDAADRKRLAAQAGQIMVGHFRNDADCPTGKKDVENQS
jgi:integrase